YHAARSGVPPTCSYRPEKEAACNHEGECHARRGPGLLILGPGQQFKRHQPQTTEKVNRKQKHKAELSHLDQRLVRPMQEAIKILRRRQRQGKHVKMRWEKNRQGKSGQPMKHVGQPERMTAMRTDHSIVTERTARSPAKSRSAQNASAITLSAVPRSLSVSDRIALTPIDA